MVERVAAVLLAAVSGADTMADDRMMIDDRSSGTLQSTLGTSWRLVTDDVMGGVSSGRLDPDRVDGRDCLRLRGDVRLENRGGFVQAALDVEGTAAGNASAFQGVLLEVYGNDQAYNLHLRSDAVWLPWQAYRATFQAPAGWHTVRLPFAGFDGYRIGAELDTGRLERIGIVAIGRAFAADLCVATVALYTDEATLAED